MGWAAISSISLFAESVLSGVSAAARHLLETLTPQRRPPHETLQSERQAWIDNASLEPLAPGTESWAEVIGGVPCLWVSHGSESEEGVVIFVHGGGLTCGSPLTHRALASRLAVRFGLPVLLIDYRLLPEHPLSAACDDVLTVIDVVLENRHCPASRVFIAGDSSGAGLMLGALMQRRDKGLRMPARSIALCGAFDATLSGESYAAERDPTLSRAVLEDWQNDLGDVDRSDPCLSPLLHDLSGLPPILIVAGGRDMWFSDSKRLFDVVAEAGGAAKLRIWDEMWHCWPLHGDFPEARAAIDEMASFLAPALENRS